MSPLEAVLVIIAYLNGTKHSLPDLFKALHVIVDTVCVQAEVTNPALILTELRTVFALLKTKIRNYPAWVPGAVEYAVQLFESYLLSRVK